MKRIHSQLEEIIRYTTADSSGGVWFAGQPVRQWGGKNTTEALQNALYGRCYTRPLQAVPEQPILPDAASDARWLQELSAANASRERWERGWVVEQFLSTGQIVAGKGQISRTFAPNEFICPNPGGKSVTVRLPRESKSLQSGFYFAFGERPASSAEELPAVRFYWNIRPGGAATLTNSITTTLNRYQVPFQFKIVNSLAFVGRTDAAVLYVGRRYCRIGWELVTETYDRIENEVNESVPMFTLPLRPGLAFAEDPGTQESFGMSRCRLVAESLLSVLREGIADTNQALQRITNRFASAGIDIECPYCSQMSNNYYGFLQ